MPAVAVFVIVLAAVYHFCFRFERWHNTDKPGIVYEHDNLTGETRTIRPDDNKLAEGSDYRTDVSGRILGDENGTSDDINAPRNNNGQLSPEAAYSQEQAAARHTRNGDVNNSMNLWGEPLVVDGTTGNTKNSNENATANSTDPDAAAPRRDPNAPRLRPLVESNGQRLPVENRRRHPIAIRPETEEEPFVSETPPDDSIPPVPSRTYRRRVASIDSSKQDTPTLKSWDWRDERQVEKVAKSSIPTPRRVMMATVAPPVPTAQRLNDVREVHVAPYAVQKMDLNHDGANEDIIQSASRQDGLLDISIVQNGREIFFGRGRQIALLPGRTRDGWADIALQAHGKVIGVFRYNPAQDVYTVITDRSSPI